MSLGGQPTVALATARDTLSKEANHDIPILIAAQSEYAEPK
jgi:hypothetical protein